MAKKRSTKRRAPKGGKPKKQAKAKPLKTKGQALAANYPHVRAMVAAAATQAMVDFTPRPTDQDVSNSDDAELGNSVRMKTERGDGAWVFEASDNSGDRRRWLRTVPR